MSDVQLGTCPAANAARDAIHVAVVPMVAAVELQPGQHVGLSDDGRATPDGDVVGVVDPFRSDVVQAGGRFWLCLMPNTVTGMRHHWSHPLFADLDRRPKPTKEESEAWLREFAKTADCPSFDILIAAASGGSIDCVDEEYYGTYENDGEYLFFSGRDAHGEIPAEFWDHVENFTGKTCPMRAKWFSCSC